jgi:hypothetical protein
MKYNTYLLLIGAASACINQDITDKSAARATATATFNTEFAKKTADVEAFEAELKEAQDHVNEMKGELKIAKVGKDQEEITKAETNETTSETLLNNLLTKDGNAAFNKILIDIEDAKEAVDAADAAYITAQNMCFPPVLQEYVDEQVAAHKTEHEYDAKTTDEKAALDEKWEKMLEKKKETTAELKNEAKYHEMSQAEKDMFDTVLVAQWKVQKDKMSKMDETVNRGDKTKEEFDAMTDEEKAAMKDKMKDMREMFEQKMDDRMKSDMDMKN